MIFILLNLTVWQNIYRFDQRTRGTNVLLLNNDTIIISGGYGDNFSNTIVMKLNQFGNYIDARRTSNSRGGIIPGGYVINPSNEVVITGEGIVDNNNNNKDITILKINTQNLNVIANKVIGLPGAQRHELGLKFYLINQTHLLLVIKVLIITYKMLELLKLLFNQLKLYM